jgi:tRNA threonylcarbamoyl adenosine modification protein YjeE
MSNRTSKTASDTKAAALTRRDILTSHSDSETRAFARRELARYWEEIEERGVVFGLSGPLGAGKTQFAKGAAEFLGIDEPVTSPSYTYHLEYSYTKDSVHGKLQHVDLWRVEDAGVLEKLRLRELLEPGAVVLVEWWQQGGEFLEELIAAQSRAPLFVAIELEPDSKNQKRTVTILEKDYA